MKEKNELFYIDYLYQSGLINNEEMRSMTYSLIEEIGMKKFRVKLIEFNISINLEKIIPVFIKGMLLSSNLSS